MSRIIQIIAADRWRAVFAERGEDGAVELHVERLACWGLQEDEEGFRWTAGFGASDLAYPCESADNFVAYVYLDDPIEDLRPKAERMLRRLEEREKRQARLEAAGYQRGTNRGVVRWFSPVSRQWISQRDALKQLEQRGVA